MRLFAISLQLLLLLFSSFASCDTLRFSSIDYCPFTCDPIKENGKEGIMTDVVRAAFEEAGYDLQIEMMPYARAVRAAGQGTHDGIMVVGKNYAPDLIYPEIPTLTQRMMFMVKPSSRWRYAGYQSLLELTTAMLVVKGFDYADDEINKYVSIEHDNLVTLHGSKTTERGLKLLSMGRVDTYIEGELTALYHIDKYSYSGEFIAAGFSARAFEDYTGFNPGSPDASRYAQILTDKIIQLKQSGELKIMLQAYGITSVSMLDHPIGQGNSDPGE